MNAKRYPRSFAGLALVALLAAMLAGCGGPSPQLAATQTARAEERDIAGALAPICDGRTITEAAAYSQAAGVHPTIVLRGTPSGSWTVDDEQSLAAWRPQPLASVELVACLQMEEVLLETCPYKLQNNQQASVERYQYVTRVALYEAATGQLVAETSWTGSEPAKCSSETKFEEGKLLKKLYGVGVSEGEVTGWLKPHVERP